MIGVFAALAAFAIDQITKAIVVANAATLSAGISVFPGFNLVFYRNDGVTFGMLGGAENAVETLAYGAIIGGALGNVIDRVRYRAVTDFLDFYIGTTHWPAFNLADVFVVSGVGLLLAAAWISARRSFRSTTTKCPFKSAR